ncbi:hypothetical protein AG1IA_10473 [Rhizoctonia solani AG-1 IA]|uniref:Uncharacterized protein n=1 Tax=Thanatephorus cucumeris (strain AG1-IA) TaxID=983506 RepID=L8WFK7_THACA|nr:hypothetical protein AG1IA_10473 [Rhizoctonia solani AG-1 IA]
MQSIPPSLLVWPNDLAVIGSRRVLFGCCPHIVGLGVSPTPHKPLHQLHLYDDRRSTSLSKLIPNSCFGFGLSVR